MACLCLTPQIRWHTRNGGRRLGIRWHCWNYCHYYGGLGGRASRHVLLSQIAPFPYDLFAATLQQHPRAKFIWAQEEPKNMGAYGYVEPRFRTAVRYAATDYPYDVDTSVMGGEGRAGGGGGGGGGGGDGGDEGGGPVALAMRDVRLKYVGRPLSCSIACDGVVSHSHGGDSPVGVDAALGRKDLN